ncbi:hypothetical protein R1sor_006483 [Riccia sorocarpa]|uniref:Uncharacterized protein n=1 Tax=Riccia sorocarpa TaxID=122646 RepID=A0ABD3HR57_9MARC
MHLTFLYRLLIPDRESPAVDNHGDDFEHDTDQDDDADYEDAHMQNNVGRDVKEDPGALPNADYNTRTSPSRRRSVTAEDVADLERRRDRIWWDVDLLKTKKMRMGMEMEDLEGALARADSNLQAAIRKLQQVEEDLINKVDGQKQCLNFLTREVEQAKRQSANISRFSAASGHLNIQDSDLATEPVDADRYNNLLIHARQVEVLLKTFREGYLDPHVEVNRSNHDSAQGECSSRPGLFDGLLAAVQEAMESPSEEENSLGSLLAAIEQEAEHTNSPCLQGQESLGQPSGVARPPLFPAVVSRGTARGRGRAGQTHARQVIGRGSSQDTKRSAGGVVVPFADAGSERGSQQAQGDDDDTEAWTDFAEYQARAAANAKTKKWEDWKAHAFRKQTDIDRERAETTARIIAEEKAQWDAIVATFP